MSIYLEHTQNEEQLDTLLDRSAGFAIVLHNDEVNTFDHVIDCLVKYCKHSEEQAEQCSLIVHYKGKCVVKQGDADELQPICDALCRKGLSATLEEMA